ncbi:hypothetical protein ACFYXC_40215 [Streptomyces sp. NPDC002701]|uniref:hypothetical protein n=1 Tax=Streptomyces sp. NPDC002701 TaxID=3364661 RepID=UPI00369800C1
MTPHYFTALCAATGGGYRLRVLGEDDSRDLVRLDLDWDEFSPQSAGDRLVENGYMIHPAALSNETMNGWTKIPAQDRAWVVSVVSVDRTA